MQYYKYLSTDIMCFSALGEGCILGIEKRGVTLIEADPDDGLTVSHFPAYYLPASVIGTHHPVAHLLGGIVHGSAFRLSALPRCDGDVLGPVGCVAYPRPGLKAVAGRVRGVISS